MMIKNKRVLSPLALAAATFAATFVTAGAYAQTPAASDASAAAPMSASAPAPGMARPMGPHGPRGPHPKGPGGPGGPGFAHDMAQLHDRLNLTAAQEQAWQQAQSTSKSDFDKMRENHEAAHAQFKELASAPVLDLSALQAQREKVGEDDHALRRDTETAFITFYNMLDDKQKAIVSNDIKSHWRRMMGDQGPRGRKGHPPMHTPGDAPPPPAGAAAAAK